MSELSLGKKTLVTPPTAAALFNGLPSPITGRVKPDRYRFLSLDLAEPNLGIPITPFGVIPPLPLITNFYGLSVLIYLPQPASDTTTYYLSTDIRGRRGWTNLVGDAIFSSLERPDLLTTDAALEELLYKFPQILTFTLSGFNSPVFVQPGDTISPGVLAWTYNKTNLAAVLSTFIFANNVLHSYISDQQYSFRSIPLNLSGLFASSPTISATVQNIGNVRSAPTFTAQMNSDNTILTGIEINNPGIIATYDIRIDYNPPPITAPEIKYLELNRFTAPPLSSIDIGTINTSTSANQTSSFTLTAVDWAGNKAIRNLNITTTGFIYYGRSVRGANTITPGDITATPNTSKGDQIRLSTTTARSYVANCSDGEYFFIAYPSYIPTPSIVARGFLTTPLIVNRNIINTFGNTIDYTVLISNNIQTGQIPLVIS